MKLGDCFQLIARSLQKASGFGAGLLRCREDWRSVSGNYWDEQSSAEGERNAGHLHETNPVAEMLEWTYDPQ